MKSLGTTDITSTIDMLDSLYNELEIFKVGRRNRKLVHLAKLSTNMLMKDRKISNLVQISSNVHAINAIVHAI